MNNNILTAGLLAAVLAAGAPAAVHAVDCENPKKASGSLSESTYRRMTKIQEDIGEKKYREAIEQLDKLVERVKRNDYE